jgi:hypothetical protein
VLKGRHEIEPLRFDELLTASWNWDGGDDAVVL